MEVNQTASDSCEEELLQTLSLCPGSSDLEHRRQVSVATRASMDSGAESSSPPNSAPSQKFSDCSHESLSPPNSAKSVTPPSSVDLTSSTSQDGDSKHSSRVTSSETAPSVLEQSSSQDDERISHAVAETVSFSTPQVSSRCNELTELGWGKVRISQGASEMCTERLDQRPQPSPGDCEGVLT